ASNPLVALAARAGLTTAVTPDDLVQLYATNGTAVPYSISDPLETRYDQLSNKVRSTASKLGKDISFQQALTSQSSTLLNDPIMRYFGAAWTEFDTGAPLNELSALQGMEDEAFGGTDVIVTNGYDRILTPLMNGFEVRTGTPVEAIQQSATDVTVRYTQGGCRCCDSDSGSAESWGNLLHPRAERDQACGPRPDRFWNSQQSNSGV
ncbi:MAG: hypothetical protein EBS30_19575, partial [Planctomycetes bacterium]|nr:hypothetical protein [Planctomycetota bacterium]